MLESKGYVELSKSNVKLTIDAKVSSVWHSDLKRMRVTSEPLSLAEIHEIDEELGSGDVQVSWSLDAWGFLEESSAAKYGISSTLTKMNRNLSKHPPHAL